MLDADTKRRIDNCRDILVGKIPDPKSQVEQITIALIYKFMDDMDRESIEMGGKAGFFKGEYKKYSWTNIFDPRIGGHDLINLYSETLDRMNQNPNVPQLFRDIFKNAFLPYRDPETLRIFLKEIDNFRYDHSEKLGDAFEYLLSVLSSQGDAGQFRTPRHIIDFIVEVIEPRKNDTVLDPACGTAGFLISAYKHIVKNNQKLNPDEKKRILNNFVGYDISPDMVRLSLVNMYLHGFVNPKIHEYDTLTSEDKWGETFDVIMANPPFMTPKGGIRPHSKFAISAKRSEVLFVDYIAEHLNPQGRTGVIVPEGIIFQSQNAYKALRKMLVENYLWAVVSLPAGIFNPYSGVKTSILLMDKSLAKRIDKILFIKIDNDGFDLGAQRRAIDKNDLTAALKFLKVYKSKIENYKSKIEESSFAHAVLKSEIAKSGDYNLTGERYRSFEHKHTGKFELVQFDKVCTLEYGKSLPEAKRIKGEFPVVGSNGITGWHNEYLVKGPVIIIGRKGSAGEVVYIEQNCTPIDTTYYIKPVDVKKINLKFLFYILKTLNLSKLKDGAGIPGLNRNDVYTKKKIPLPPLEIQEKIVSEIDGYQKIIDGARQIVENYKPTIKINPDWPMVKFIDIVGINRQTIDPAKEYGQKEFIYIDISSVGNGDGGVSFANKVKGDDAPSRARRKIRNGDILLSTVRPNLKAFAYLHDIPENAIASTGFAVLSPTDKIIGQFLYYLLFEDFLQGQMIKRMGKGAYPSINQTDVEELKMPLPPINEQKQIVAEIEAEQTIVNENKKLIVIFEKKIKDKISEVWGESGFEI